MSNSRQGEGPRPLWARRNVQIGAAILGAVLLVLVSSRGWRPSSRTSSSGMFHTPGGQAAQQSQLLELARDTFRRPEIFESDEAIEQVLDRLNQWVQSQEGVSDWRLDPLAAPLLNSVAEVAGRLRPLSQALAGPESVLELKWIARRFELLPAALEKLAQRQDLQRLDQLARQCEEAARQFDEAARPLDNAAMVARAEQYFIQQFLRRVQDPARQAAFGALCQLAQQLDYAGRLRDPGRLAAFAQALEALAAKYDRKQVEALVSEYEGVVVRYSSEGWEGFAEAGQIDADGRRLSMPELSRTRLSAQLRFVFEQWDHPGLLKDLAGLKGLIQDLGEVAERLRICAARTDREALRQLAAELEKARDQRDIQALKQTASRLSTLADPGSFQDLERSAGQLQDQSQRLVELEDRLVEFARKMDLKTLQGLADYVAALGRQVASAAKILRSGPQDADPQKLGQWLDQFTTEFRILAMRVRRLADELNYLATLADLHFPDEDRDALREALLLRDLSRWVRGEEPDDLSRAKRLFDWTVRNIQLEPDQLEHQGQLVSPLMKRPMEVLIRGTGTAMERAWVFILLARQQGLDAVVLALQDPADPLQQRVIPWVVAVLSEGNLYLFDPYIGLPVPGPDGIRLDESGQLDLQPAALAQVVADHALLHQMDLDREHPYRVKPSELNRVVALVEGSAPYLAQRMRLVESQLGGQDQIVLTAAPEALAERLKSSGQLAEVRLWMLPYETLFQQSQLGEEGLRRRRLAMIPFWEASSGALWRGRILHLRGNLTGESTAPQYYQKTRSPGRQAEAALAADPDVKFLGELARQCASYWLGLLAFDQANYPMALGYFRTRTLEAFPDGAWTAGARYNLGRVYEAQKQYREAIEQYLSNKTSVDYYGNQLRAKWLGKLTGTEVRLPPEIPRKVGPELPELPGLPSLPGLPDEPESQASMKSQQDSAPKPDAQAPNKAPQGKKT